MLYAIYLHTIGYFPVYPLARPGLKKYIARRPALLSGIRLAGTIVADAADYTIAGHHYRPGRMPALGHQATT